MPLLDRFRRSESTRTVTTTAVPHPTRVLRADGQRVDLTARDAGTRLTLIRQDWQNDAWTYRDMIGELRFAQQLLSRSVAKVRFFAAELRDYPDQPVELSGTEHEVDSRLAEDAVANLARLPLDDGPDGFLATLTENLKTAGEAWIHGEPDEEDGEKWTVRSVSEITGAGDRILVSELPGTLSQRALNPDREELLRCWVRHPRWGKLADSPLRAMLDVLEEVVLNGREMRAASRSRIASNGLLLLPMSLTLLRARQDEEDLVGQSVDEDDFMADFTEALTAPIRNEGDPGAVVPLVLRGDAEAIKEVRHLTLTRDDAIKLMERLQGAILRMLQGLDIQPEKVTGIGETNHWCKPDNTEIFTYRSGWTHHSDLQVGDVVLTLNHVTGNSEWQPVLDIYRAQVVDEPMHEMRSASHVSLSTAGHRWPIIKKGKCAGSPRRWTTSGAGFTAGDRVPVAAPCVDDVPAKYTDDFVRLAAVYTSDGTVLRYESGTPYIRIAKFDPDEIIEVRRVLRSVYGQEPAEHDHPTKTVTGVGFCLKAQQSTVLFAITGEHKALTRTFVNDLTPAQRALLLDAMVAIGDGVRHRSGHVFFQKERARLDALEHAAILAGYKVTSGRRYQQTGYGVEPLYWLRTSISRTTFSPWDTTHRSQLYTGVIWCPTTENGTWLARSPEGSVYYTGNSGWQVEASDVRHQVIPTCGIVAGVLTKAFLRPALRSLGYPADQVRRVGVWYDPTSLVESPDRSQDARDAWDREAIKDASLREALGFSDDDAPDPSEHLIRLLSRGRLAPQAIPLIAALSGVKLDAPDVQRALAIAVGVNQNQNQGSGGPRGLPPGQSANPPTPDQVVPEQPTPQEPAPNDPSTSTSTVVGSGSPVPGWRVDLDNARRLAQVDTTLVERILTASDAAITRAVERAGGRVRNATRRDAAVAASLRDMDTVLVAAVLGRATVTSFVSITDLLAGAYTRLRDQVNEWLDQAAGAVADIILDLMGISHRDPRATAIRNQIITRYAVHRDAAWSALSSALDAATERALFRADPLTPEPGRGEQAGTLLPPSAVVAALRIAGGGRPEAPGDGFGTGQVAQQTLTDQGGVVLGWEWQYYPEHPRGSHFLPHQVLNGARFATWTDPKLDTGPGTEWVGPFFHPQDHLGCFVAGTVISGPPAFGSFVRPYIGEGIELRTDTGKLLTGTPNHPILTSSGWIPMGELAEGNEVVVSSGDQGALEIDHETHQMPALIEDVATSLPMASSVVTRPVPSAPEHFHGDGTGSDGQITVIRTDSRLLAHHQPTGLEFRRDDVLQLGSETPGPLSSSGISNSLLPGDGRAAHDCVSSRGEGFSLVGGALLVSDEQSVAAVPALNSVFSQDPRDRGTVDAVSPCERELADTLGIGRDNAGLQGTEVFRGGHAVLSEELSDGGLSSSVPTAEILERFAGRTTLEKVVNVDRVALNCHVYNLSTVTGWYVANGVIVHNCRCGSSPVIAFPEVSPTDDPDDIVGRRLREAAQSEHGRIATRVAAEDTAAGRRGTSLQNEVETRDRIRAGVEQLRAHYIERAGV